ncbi:MAG: peptidoglycan-binding protein [Candidatus Pacebacteria bacterium]|nr:peptidoglycan-binding protein [Candidatus Paceibacterota bacterium]
MNNVNVKALQTCLNTKIPTLVPQLVPDGIFGPKTYQAVIIFQKANSLKIDGIVGPITRGALLK